MSLNAILSSDSVMDDLDVQLSHPTQNSLRVESEGHQVESLWQMHLLKNALGAPVMVIPGQNQDPPSL